MLAEQRPRIRTSAHSRVLALVQVLPRVGILKVRIRLEMQLEIRRVELKVIVVRNVVRHLFVQQDGRLVGPGPRDVADRVSTTSQHQHRQTKAFHKLDALAVTYGRPQQTDRQTSAQARALRRAPPALDRQRTPSRDIEAAESVARE